jgi:hypothetical protein
MTSELCSSGGNVVSAFTTWDYCPKDIGYTEQWSEDTGHSLKYCSGIWLDVLNKTTKKPQPVKWPRCGSSTSMHTNCTAMLGFSQDGGTLADCIHRHQEVICLIAAQHCAIPREENSRLQQFKLLIRNSCFSSWRAVRHSAWLKASKAIISPPDTHRLVFT